MASCPQNQEKGISIASYSVEPASLANYSGTTIPAMLHMYKGHFAESHIIIHSFSTNQPTPLESGDFKIPG